MLSFRSLIARRALLVGTVLTVGVAGTAGTVISQRTAATPGPSATSKHDATPGRSHHHGAKGARFALHALIESEAKTIGQTPKQVLGALLTGKTLAQIAGGQAGQVKTDALAKFKARLDKAVAAQKMTQAEADARLAAASTAIDAAMTKDLSSEIKEHDAKKADHAGKHGGQHGADAPSAPSGSTNATPGAA